MPDTPHASNRSNRPFVPVNCGAIPETSWRVSFFGYGQSFTGASAARKGRVASGPRGDVNSSDEIGELPLSLQVKLLRLLQERNSRARWQFGVRSRRFPADFRDPPGSGGRGPPAGSGVTRLPVACLSHPDCRLLRERPEDVVQPLHYFWDRRGETRAVDGSGVAVPPNLRMAGECSVS